MESLSAKDKLDDKNCPHKRSSVFEDLNNNSLKFQECGQNYLANKGNKEANVEKQGRHKDPDEKHSSSQNISREKVQMDGEKTDKPVFSKTKNCDKKAAEFDTLPGSKNAEDSLQKARPDSKDSRKSSSDRGRLKNDNRSLSPERSQKQSKILKVANITDDSRSTTSGSSEAQNGKRPNEQDSTLKLNKDPENKEHSKHKKAKAKHVENESKSKEPSLSFESYLNYDVNVLKRKVKSGGKPPKKTVGKDATKESGMEAFSSKLASCVASEKQVSLTMTQNIVAVRVSCRMSTKLLHFSPQVNVSVMELVNLHSPGGPLEYESPITVSHSEKKGTKKIT